MADEEIILTVLGHGKPGKAEAVMEENADDSPEEFEILLSSPVLPEIKVETQTEKPDTDLPEVEIKLAAAPGKSQSIPEVRHSSHLQVIQEDTVEIKLKPHLPAEKKAAYLPPPLPGKIRKRRKYRGHKVGCFLLLLAMASIVYWGVRFYRRYEEPITRYRLIFERYMSFK